MAAEGLPELLFSIQRAFLGACVLGDELLRYNFL